MGDRTIMTIRRAFTGLTAAALSTAGLALLPGTPALAGPVGVSDFRISNQTVPGGIDESSIAYDAARDRFLVVWEGVESTPNGDRAEIFGRLVNARNGSTIGGSDLKLAEMTPLADGSVDAISPSVVYNPTADEYVIAFAGDDDTRDSGTIVSDTFEIYAQRLNGGATPVGSPVRISDMGVDDTSGSYDALDPDIVYNATDNEYFVVWSGDDNTPPFVNNELEIYGQRLSSTLAELGTNDVHVNETGADGDATTDARRPAVTWAASTDRYMVVYDGNYTTNAGVPWTRILGRMVDANGTPRDIEIELGGAPYNDTTIEQYAPDVAWDSANDRFTVVWEGDAANGTPGSANDFEIFGVVLRDTTNVPGGGFSQVGSMSQLTHMGTDGAGYVANDAALVYNPLYREYLLSFTADDNTGGQVDNHYETYAERLSPTLATSGLARVSSRGPLGSTNTEPQPSAVGYSERSVGTYLVTWAGEAPALAAGESEVFGRLVGSAVDLSVTRTASPTSPASAKTGFYPSDSVSYTITYGNSGDQPAYDVVVDAPLPTGVVYDSFSSPSSPAPALASTSPLSFTVDHVDPGTSGTITVQAHPVGGLDEGTVLSSTATIGSTAVVDDANSSNNSAGTTLTIDNPPTVTALNRLGSSPTNASTVTWRIIFDQSISGLTASNFGLVSTGTVSGASITTVAAEGPANQWLITADTGTGDGTLRLDLVNGTGIKDSSNKALVPPTLPASFPAVTIDKTRPTLTLTAPPTDPTNTAPIPVTATFSEAVTGFTAGDVNASGATVSNFSGSGTTYTFDLTSPQEGPVTVDVAGGSAQDAAGNGNTAATRLTRTYDSVRPSVTLGSAVSDPTNASPIAVTVTFSEAVADFALGDLTVTNGSASNLTGSGTSYSVDITPAGQGLVSVDVDAGVAHDAAGNGNTAASTLSRTFDSVRPLVDLTTTAGNPTNVSPIPVTITFSKPVSGFTEADLAASNGSLSGFAGTGSTYTVDLVPAADGPVTLDLPAGAASDDAGNTNAAAATLHRTYDSVGPDVTLSTSASDPTKTSPIPVTVTFAEPVSGFTASDLVVSNGTASNLGGSGAVYTVHVAPSGQGAVTVDLAADQASDAAGNGNTAASQLSVVYDSVRPDVTLSTTAGDPTNGSPIPVSVTFTEPVTGLTAGDFVTTNGTVGNLAGSGSAYTLDLTPTANGVVTLDLPAASAVDAAGNTSTAAAQLSRAYDSARPSVELTTTAPDPTQLADLPVTVQFSRDVTGLTLSDFDPTGSTVSDLAEVDGDTYTLTWSPTQQGTVSLDLPAGAAETAAGNTNTAAAQLTRVYDSIRPDITVEQAAGQRDPTRQSPVLFSIKTSEPVTGLRRSDLLIGGSAGADRAHSTLDQVGPRRYVASIGGMARTGNVRLGVVGDAARDAAGNTSRHSTSVDNTVRWIRNAAPTLVIHRGGCLDPGTTASIAVTVRDADGDPLTVTGTSSNQRLLPDSAIRVTRTAPRLLVKITPSVDRRGTSVVTLTVSDGTTSSAQVLQLIVGGARDEQLRGTAGRDVILGRGGDDVIRALGGNDLVCTGPGNNTVFGGGGADTVQAGTGDDRMVGGGGNDVLRGGGAGHDVLVGGAGNDVMRGGHGNDRLTGGTGADRFDGGEGRDVYVDFNPAEGDRRGR